MKAKIVTGILLIIIGLSISLSAQVRYVRNIPIQLPLTYLYDPQYTPKQIYPTPDGGIIVLGDCLAHYGDPYNPELAGDCGAIKLDAFGNCQWQWWSRNFIGWGSPNIVGIDQEIDGKVNLLINVGDDYNQIGWINPNGTSNLEYIQLPHIGISRAKRLINGDIFVIGSSTSQSLPYPNNICAAFLRLNAQGDSLSMHLYGVDSLWIQPGSRFAIAYDMELDTDDMPVATCQFTDRFASVVKTDWDGNLIWRRDTSNPLCRNQRYPITKIPLTNEIVFGYQAYNNNYRNQFSVYRVSGTGLDSLYSIQMSDTICVGSYYSMVGHNQGIYLSGSFSLVSSGLERVTNYNLQGQQNWEWSIITPFINGNQQTDCITVLPDSSIIHVFGNDNLGDFSLTIIKLNPDGTATEDEYCPKPKLELCAYPNPMKGFINLKLTSGYGIKDKSIPIQIYNIKGQLVKSLNATSKSSSVYNASWDGKDEMGRMCASGTYIIWAKSDRMKLSKKILLVK